MQYTPGTRVHGDPIHPDMSSVRYLGPRYLRERRGDFTDTTLSAKLGSLAVSQFLLFPPELSNIDIDNTEEASSVALTGIPELEKGRENSRNAVQFGQLHISSDKTNPTSALVAVKYLNRLAAPREFHAARAINDRFGENAALQPIGFVRNPKNDKVGYVSHYEHGVVTLDNILWNTTSTPTQREKAMAFAGLWLANLHNHQIIHGDAQAKNIAADTGNRPRYVDLEGARDFDKNDPMSRIQRLNDVHDLFNITYMPPTSKDENMAFTQAYLDQQGHSMHYIDGHDIQEVIHYAKSA